MGNVPFSTGGIGWGVWGKGRTSPLALKMQDSPSSPAAAAADSTARLASTVAVGAASADILSTDDDIQVGIEAMDGLGEVVGRGAAAAAPTVVSCCG
jgi:hypothetical protein